MIYREKDGNVSIMFDSILELMSASFEKMRLDQQATEEVIDRNEKEFKDCLTEVRHVQREVGALAWLGPGNNTPANVIEHALLGNKILEDSLSRNISALSEYEIQTKDFVSKIDNKKRVRRKREFGDEIDIHKVYRGELSTAWSKMEFEKNTSEKKMVTIFVDIVDHWRQKVTETLWNCVSSVVLCKKLEAQGRSVKIIVGGRFRAPFSTAKFSSCSVGIVVKDYNQKMVSSRIAAMCNLGFARVFTFAALSFNPYSVVAIGKGYPERVSEKTLPIHLVEEVEKGHTKIIVLGKSYSLIQAVDSIKKAEKQMIE